MSVQIARTTSMAGGNVRVKDVLIALALGAVASFNYVRASLVK